jgi:hypothetical protein
METAREFLTKIAVKEGWDTDDDGLGEILCEGNIVHTGKDDVHRWYIRRPTVTEVEGVFIKFWDYIITGDNSMSDMDLHYDIDLAKIVERKEREVIEVYYE